MVRVRGEDHMVYDEYRGEFTKMITFRSRADIDKENWEDKMWGRLFVIGHPMADGKFSCEYTGRVHPDIFK